MCCKISWWSSLLSTSSITTGRAQPSEGVEAAAYVPTLWINFFATAMESFFCLFVCLFPGLQSTPGNGGLRLSCTRAPWRRVVESPWLRGGWQEHRACFVIMKNAQSTRWRVAKRLCTARSEPCRWHEQGRGGVPRPVGFDLSRSEFSNGVHWVYRGLPGGGQCRDSSALALATACPNFWGSCCKNRIYDLG